MSYARQAVTRLTLNMGLPDAQGSFSCTLGDVNRRLEVTLIDHGEPFALPPDWTAFLAGVKPDGTRLANSCVVDRGRIIYDFSGGAEIATCPGVFAVVFEVYDELGELVATPKVWVHVADNAGARIVNSADQFSVLSELIGRINGAQEDANDLKVKVEDLMDKAVSAGTVTIPMSEWTDAAPTMASVKVSGVDAGSIILMLPADEKTRLTANNAKLSAHPAAFAIIGGDGSVSILRAEAETIPDSDMTFAYIVLKTGFSFENPVAAIVGVDAYGEGGGGSADEATIDAKIAEHNTANDSHQDIRLMIKEHEESVNALLNSDDETLNETKEIVAYIKSNKSLIDAITTSKVNVADIVDNLTTNAANKPLSAAQGVKLQKQLNEMNTSRGIYVGGDQPPDGVIVWVNPNGTPLTLYTGEVEEA